MSRRSPVRAIRPAAALYIQWSSETGMAKCGQKGGSIRFVFGIEFSAGRVVP